MTTGIDYTGDGRAQSPAGGQGGVQRLQMSEADTAAGQRTDGRGFQSSGGLVTRCRLQPQWTDLPGNPWSQGAFAAAEEGKKYLLLPPYPALHSPISASHPPVWEKQPTRVRPFDSERDRERARNRPRGNSQGVHCSNPMKPFSLSQDPAHIYTSAQGHCQLLKGLSQWHLL